MGRLGEEGRFSRCLQGSFLGASQLSRESVAEPLTPPPPRQKRRPVTPWGLQQGLGVELGNRDPGCDLFRVFDFLTRIVRLA